MCEIKYIKIFDEEVALALSERGFSYMQEQINHNQMIYVFENTEEFMAALCEIIGDGDPRDVIYVEDSLLRF